MQKLHQIVILLLLSLLLVACGGGAAGDAQGAAGGNDSAAVAQDETPQTEDEAPKPEDANEADTDANTSSDEWSGSNFNANLDSLDSYTAVFTYEQGEGDAKQTWSWQQRMTREPRAMEMYSNDKGTDSSAGAYHLVQIGDAIYSVSKDPVQCIKVTNQSQDQGMSPDSVLTGLPFSMKKVGAGPDLFGRATDEYTYQADDIDGSSYDATAIVDREGGFAYSYDVTGTQKNGDKQEPFAWKYELKDVNSGINIEVPAECAAIESGLQWPLPDDAKVTMQTNEMLSFETTKPLKELAKFYDDEMANAGYTTGEGGMSMDNTVMAVYTKDLQTVTVMMTLQDGKTTVIITTQQ